MSTKPMQGKSDLTYACSIVPVTLRGADEHDQPFLLSVYADSRAEEMQKIDHWTDTEKAEFISFQFFAQHEHYKKHYPKAEFLIIVVDGQDIGRLYVERTPKDICVMDITLLHQYRRQGIGRKLMTDLLNEAKSHQQTVNLHVEPDNVAKKLYLSLGFCVVGEMSFYEKMECAC